MPERQIKLAPSILSANFGCLGEQITEATSGGADYIHLDIMDGQFVPNLTFGPVVIEGIKSFTHLPLDAHLMVVEPDRLINDFVNAGVDHITVHVEACLHLHRVIYQIKDQGRISGVALNPATPLSAIEEVLPLIDRVLILTVNPGFGGQSMIHETLDKVRRLNTIISQNGYQIEIEVDGGVNDKTAPDAVTAGANTLVAGSAIFNNRESISSAIKRLRNSLENVATN